MRELLAELLKGLAGLVVAGLALLAFVAVLALWLVLSRVVFG